ncbi:MAG: hypothetical protein JSV78_13795 [Phycisphaerales bacterium]|nr:MAG: hypothetical protein JSV78_13795 [Phycisphaerales bacterium]
MDDPKPRVEELLLDYHLNQVDGDEAARLREELRSNADLRAKSERIKELLKPLDAYTVPPAPADLSERVLGYVEESIEAGKVEAPAVVSFEKAKESREWLFSGRELLAMAACLFLVFSVMMPRISDVRDRPQKSQTASVVPFLDSADRSSVSPGGRLETVPSVLADEGYRPMPLQSGSGYYRVWVWRSARRLVHGVPVVRLGPGDTVPTSIGCGGAAGATEAGPVALPMPIAIIGELRPLFEDGWLRPDIVADQMPSSVLQGRHGHWRLMLDDESSWQMWLFSCPDYGYAQVIQLDRREQVPTASDRPEAASSDVNSSSGDVRTKLNKTP